MIAAAAAIIVATVPASLRASSPALAVAEPGAAAGHQAPPGHGTAAVAPDAVRARHGSQHGPAALGPARTVSPAPGAGALPAGFSRYRDRGGFSIAVPRGWHVSRRGHRVYVRDPQSRRFLIIGQTTHPRPHPLAAWRRRAATRIGRYPGYHRIRLAVVRYAPAERAADWEFTYYRNGQLTRVLDRDILVSARHGYALYWSVPARRWRGSFHYFRTFAATFRPATAARAG